MSIERLSDPVLMEKHGLRFMTEEEYQDYMLDPIVMEGDDWDDDSELEDDEDDDSDVYDEDDMDDDWDDDDGSDYYDSDVEEEDDEDDE